ncbi:MAG: tetraacyldisaccharide 4'-kinase [Rhodomicrobium sp.]
MAEKKSSVFNRLKLEPPSWWYEGQIPAAAWGLLPVSAIYGALVQRRFRKACAYRSKLPVICVGNFTAGGAGKTPVALKLASLLRDQGRKPGFLTRGFGGIERGPHLVDPVLDDAARVGDEPLLLAEAAATVVSRDRPLGARLLETLGLDTIIMDDGFQNPSLKKDFSLIVIDAGAGIGSGRVFPLGPLRAPLGFQAGMADAIVILGAKTRSADVLEQINGSLRRRTPSPQPYPARGEGVGCGLCNSVPSAHPPPLADAVTLSGKLAKGELSGEGQDEGAFFARGKNVFEARIVSLSTDETRSGRFLAFCGIGRPAKFFDTLRDAGVTAVKARAFPDHHPYTEADARSLLAEAKALQAGLLTTGKDLVRLKGAAGARAELYRAALALPITVEFSGNDEALLLKAIYSCISGQSCRSVPGDA